MKTTSNIKVPEDPEARKSRRQTFMGTLSQVYQQMNDPHHGSIDIGEMQGNMYVRRTEKVLDITNFEILFDKKLLSSTLMLAMHRSNSFIRKAVIQLELILKIFANLVDGITSSLHRLNVKHKKMGRRIWKIRNNLLPQNISDPINSQSVGLGSPKNISVSQFDPVNSGSISKVKENNPFHKSWTLKKSKFQSRDLASSTFFTNQEPEEEKPEEENRRNFTSGLNIGNSKKMGQLTLLDLFLVENKKVVDSITLKLKKMNDLIKPYISKNLKVNLSKTIQEQVKCLNSLYCKYNYESKNHQNSKLHFPLGIQEYNICQSIKKFRMIICRQLLKNIQKIISELVQEYNTSLDILRSLNSSLNKKEIIVCEEIEISSNLDLNLFDVIHPGYQSFMLTKLNLPESHLGVSEDAVDFFNFCRINYEVNSGLMLGLGMQAVEFSTCYGVYLQIDVDLCKYVGFWMADMLYLGPQLALGRWMCLYKTFVQSFA